MLVVTSAWSSDGGIDGQEQDSAPGGLPFFTADGQKDHGKENDDENWPAEVDKRKRAMPGCKKHGTAGTPWVFVLLPTVGGEARAACSDSIISYLSRSFALQP